MRAQESNGLTTIEVAEACAARGVAISRSQLSRWAATGYLGRPRRTGRGAGKGRGTLELWPVDTVERVALIAPLMRTGKSVRYLVAWTLLCHGYEVRPPLFRAVLVWYARRIEVMLARLRYPCDATPAAQLRWLTQSIQHRMPDVLIRSVQHIAATVFGLGGGPRDAPAADHPIWAAMSLLGPGALHDALVGVTDDGIIAAAWRQSVVWVGLVPASVAPALGSALVDALGLSRAGVATSTSIPPDDGITALRFSVTLVLVALHHHGEALATTLYRAWDRSLGGHTASDDLSESVPAQPRAVVSTTCPDSARPVSPSCRAHAAGGPCAQRHGGLG